MQMGFHDDHKGYGFIFPPRIRGNTEKDRLAIDLKISIGLVGFMLAIVAFMFSINSAYLIFASIFPLTIIGLLSDQYPAGTRKLILFIAFWISTIPTIHFFLEPIDVKAFAYEYSIFYAYLLIIVGVCIHQFRTGRI